MSILPNRFLRETSVPDWVRSAFGVRVFPDTAIWLWVGDKSSGAVAVWQKDDWDTVQLKVRCGKILGINFTKTCEGTRLRELFSAISDSMLEFEVRYLFFRSSVHQCEAFRAGEEVGFRHLGVHLDFVRSIPTEGRGSSAHIVSPTTEDDAEAIAKMGSLFIDDRFHRENGFDPNLVASLWSESLRNAVMGRAEAVYAARCKGEIAGFVTLEKDHDDGRIFLIGVDAVYRGKGIAGSLIETALDHGRRRGWKRLWVGTQATNRAAVRVYQKQGFSLETVSSEWGFWRHE